MAAPAPEQAPEVTWAQRSSDSDAARNIVYVTIMAPDVSPDSLKLDLQPTNLSFSGYSTSKKINYKVKLDFFKEIDVAESKTHASSREIELVLRKKDLEIEYWPRLTKEKAKLHFLKTDFDKWVDEDEQDEKEEDPYANYMGDGGMGGMGGMPGMGGGMGGIDFSQLAAGGGMPNLGDLGAGMDMGDEDDDGEDGDDDDVPGLEGEDGKAAAGESSTPKIEEIS